MHKTNLLLRRRRARRKYPRFTVIRCAYNGHQVSWCRMLCTPIDGHGACGRLAAHAMKDRTQRAIAMHKARQVEDLAP